mgnify:FL=1
MSNYFNRLPNLEYPSLLKTRRTNRDTIRVKNLFRRVKIREDLFSNLTEFDKYQINGDDRPDTVAEELYGNPNLDWVILMSNNIIDIKNEWPMTQYDLNIYLDDKYTPQQLIDIHHYETLQLRDGRGRLIVPAGKVVDEDWSLEYFDGLQIRNTDSVIDGRPLKSVSFLEYEINKNDKKRNINVLRRDMLTLFMKDFERIMKYDKSSQYVDKKLKKTENIRLK